MCLTLQKACGLGSWKHRECDRHDEVVMETSGQWGWSSEEPEEAVRADILSLCWTLLLQKWRDVSPV